MSPRPKPTTTCIKLSDAHHKAVVAWRQRHHPEATLRSGPTIGEITGNLIRKGFQLAETINAVVEPVQPGKSTTIEIDEDVWFSIRDKAARTGSTVVSDCNHYVGLALEFED